MPGAIELAERQLADATNMTDRQAALAAILSSTVAAQGRSPGPAGPRVATRAAADEQVVSAAGHIDGGAWRASRGRARASSAAPSRLLHSPTPTTRSRWCVRSAWRTKPSSIGAGPTATTSGPSRCSRSTTSTPPSPLALHALLDRWRKYTPDRQADMRRALERVAAGRLSRDVREIVSKSLET